MFTEYSAYSIHTVNLSMCIEKGILKKSVYIFCNQQNKQIKYDVKILLLIAPYATMYFDNTPTQQLIY